MAFFLLKRQKHAIDIKKRFAGLANRF